MKFIAGLLVWANRGIRETPQVFPRLRGFANRRVDLHLPLIASIFALRLVASGQWPRRLRMDIDRESVSLIDWALPTIPWIPELLYAPIPLPCFVADSLITFLSVRAWRLRKRKTKPIENRA
jgi:hypothetical protein